MDAATITAVVGVVVAVLAGITVPVWLQRRKDKDSDDMAEVVSWQGLTNELRNDRNSLREQLSAIEKRHKEQITEVEKTWQSKLKAAQAEIDELRSELAVLRRAIRGTTGD